MILCAEMFTWYFTNHAYTHLNLYSNSHYSSRIYFPWVRLVEIGHEPWQCLSRERRYQAMGFIRPKYLDGLVELVHDEKKCQIYFSNSLANTLLSLYLCTGCLLLFSISRLSLKVQISEMVNSKGQLQKKIRKKILRKKIFWWTITNNKMLSSRDYRFDGFPWNFLTFVYWRTSNFSGKLFKQ